MNKLLCHIVIVCAFISVISQLNAQVVDTILADLPAEEVEVIKSFEARIEDARKINFNPSSITGKQKTKFDYEVIIRPIDLIYPDPIIKPVAMTPDQKPEKSNGYLKLGYGSLNTIQGLIAYDYLTDQETQFNFEGQYLHINDKSEPFQKYQNINGAVNVNHNINGLLSAGGSLEYNLRDVYFFGSPMDTPVQDSSKFKRQINSVEIGATLYNSEVNEYDIDYNLSLKYQNIQFLNETLQENNFGIEFNGFKTINENFKVGINGLIDISSVLDTSSINYNNYLIGPVVKFNNEKLALNAGVTFGFAEDNTHYLPDLELSYSPVDAKFIPYVFWKGSIQKNNINQLYRINPFISSSVVSDLDNTVRYKYGLGAKGILSGLSYDGSVSYGTINNILLFNSLLTEDNIRQFNFVTDTATVLEIAGGLQYIHNENLMFDVDFVFNDYKLNSNKRPWHLPSYRFDLKANYTFLNEKFSIIPSIYFRDAVYIMNEENLEEKLNPLVDFNFQFKYKIGEKIGVFAQFNNLLSSEYQQWYRHSYFGFSAVGGLSMVF